MNTFLKIVEKIFLWVILNVPIYPFKRLKTEILNRTKKEIEDRERTLRNRKAEGILAKNLISKRIDGRQWVKLAREKRAKRALRNGFRKRKHLGLIIDNGLEGFFNDFEFIKGVSNG